MMIKTLLSQTKQREKDAEITNTNNKERKREVDIRDIIRQTDSRPLKEKKKNYSKCLFREESGGL